MKPVGAAKVPVLGADFPAPLALAPTLAQLAGLVLDCDGVLTPGDLYFDEGGRRLLRFCSRDGLGLAHLIGQGIRVAVLSGRPTDIAEARLRELGVVDFVGRCRDKGAGLRALCAGWQLPPAAVAFVGDDLPDLAAFAVAGLAVAVADAAAPLLARAHWVTRARGGRGAVREICEAILMAQGRWQVG